MDPWGLWSWPWQWSWDFTIHDFSGRPFLEFRSEDVVPGIETGLAGVGSAFSFGIWDGGRWRDQPGFGVSRGLGYVGAGALGAAGAVYAGGIGWGALRGLAPSIVNGTGGTGVVYALVKDGRMVYIGRTIDHVARWADHMRDYAGTVPRTLGENLTYDEMRGLEQLFIDRIGLGNLWNMINGVALRNPNCEGYLDAARSICPR